MQNNYNSLNSQIVYFKIRRFANYVYKWYENRFFLMAKNIDEVCILKTLGFLDFFI